MVTDVVITIGKWLIILFIGYSVSALLLYYVMCVIEWCQELNNKRR